MDYLKSIECFVHSIADEKISDKIINNFQPLEVLGLVDLRFFLELAVVSGFFECAAHKCL
jgi:hypothetical protein